MATKSKITPELADKILQADLANVIKKVKEGRGLTNAERTLLQAARDESLLNAEDKAANITDLAAILGVTRRTIYDWKKIDGAPRASSNNTHDVIAWREFIRANGLKGALPETNDDGLPDESLLKRQKLAVEVAEKEFRFEVLQGKYITADEVRERWTTEVGRAVNLLRKRLENELPPILSGLDPADVQKELAAVVDEFCQSLHEGGE